eukprot:gnl/MRDRNA2_/MRDRNA2_93069_c0_seq1.p1 gnl/MRDRNA2_/MRDRNA2_93069_c0~~gnl/MRDRNA2_/MRDRNA2_93069_c0_seq1.p1  ORF type:complete len:474 (+),score=162.16 gnl/MRDRNA2_/MRDRNA2_93069_c0_seq1:84-1505(+)
MAPPALSKSASAPVVCRAGFSAHLARVERQAQEEKEKNRALQRHGAVIVNAASKPPAPTAGMDSSKQEFQRMLQSTGFRQRFSPRTQHAASFVGKLAAADKDADQGWNLLLQHDITKHKQAEQEKKRAALQKQREVGAAQRRQADRQLNSVTKALQRSRENWMTKFQKETEELKREEEEQLYRKAEMRQELNRQRQQQLEDARQRRSAEAQRDAEEHQLNAMAAREKARLREEKEIQLRADQRKALSECSKAATRAIEERKQLQLMQQVEDRKLMELYTSKMEAENERRRIEEEERVQKVKKRLALYEQSQGGSVKEVMQRQLQEDECKAEKHRNEIFAKAEAREQEKKRVRQELQKQCNESVERMLADKAIAVKRLQDEENAHAEYVFRSDAKFRADESAKMEERRRKAEANAIALKQQIQSQKELEIAGRIGSRDLEINRSQLNLAKGDLENIFLQRKQGNWPKGPVGLPG